MANWFAWTPALDADLATWREQGVKRDEICSRLGITLRQYKTRVAALGLSPSNAKATVKKKGHSEFVRELAVRHPGLEVLGLYSTALKPIRVRCKECGTISEPLPNNLLRQGPCAKCADINSGATRSLGPEEVHKRLQDMFPDYVFLNWPSNRTEKARYHCAYGHVCESTVRDLLSKKGCVYCAQAGRDSAKTLRRDPERALSLCCFYFVRHESGWDKFGIASNGASARSAAYKAVHFEVKTTRAIAWAVEHVMLCETREHEDRAEAKALGLDAFGGWTELRKPLPLGATIKRIQALIDQAIAEGWETILAS